LSLYEVHLRRFDGLDEVRITDVPLSAGQVVSIGSRTWEVTDLTRPASPDAAHRYECTELPGHDRTGLVQDAVDLGGAPR
jgi:hypothetical protein